MKNMVCTLLLIVGSNGFSQEITQNVSITHYANPELYIKAGVVCLVTDKQGIPSNTGNYLSIYNRGTASFKYAHSSSGSWNVIKPKKNMILPIQKKNKTAPVTLRVKYTKSPPGNLTHKLSELSKLNSVSDRILYMRSSAATDNEAKASIQQILASDKKTEIPRDKNSLAENPSNKIASDKKSTPKKAQRNSALQSLPARTNNCFEPLQSAYYTFYYLKVNEEVFYSDAFGVPAYKDEREGQVLLSQAWYCFVSELRTRYSEKNVYEMLHDPDNDLKTGLINLRNPFIPSSKILRTYPYTASASAAQRELVKWIRYENKTYPGLKFIKINFM